MTNKLKIGFLALPRRLFESGKVIKSGSIIINDQIISYLKKEGFDVKVFEPESEDRIELRKITGFGNALMFQDLLKRIDEINSCDVIISTNYFGLILPEIKKPVITIFHHNAKTLLEFLDHEDQIVDSVTHLLWRKIAQKYGLAHKTEESAHDKVVAILEQYLIDNSEYVVAVSGSLKSELIHKYVANSEKIRVVPNSIPPEWNNIETDKDFNARPLNLVCVTRMPGSAGGFMMKGADRIFEMFTKADDALFTKKLIASTGSKEYGKLVRDNLPKVEFIENASHDHVKDFLSSSHITIHCSRVESFGLTLIESMLLKNVVVTYPVGIAPEIIENGKNGFIVNDIDEMIGVIDSLKNRNDLSEIAGRAHQTVSEKLSPDQFGKNYLDIITEIASN